MATRIPAYKSGDASPFNRTVQHDAKRTAILSQAAKLFNFKGSRATTLKDIADSLGLTKTSLYYYVKTKEDLIYQCYMTALELHHTNLDEIENHYVSALERTSAFFRQHFENWLAAQEGRGPHIAALLEIAALKGTHRTEVEARYMALFKRLRDHIRQGVADGSLRSCEPNSTTLAILGSVDWAFSWLHRIPLEQVRDTANEALDILAHGIAAGPGAYSPADINHDMTEIAVPHGFDRQEQNRLKQEAFFKTGTRCFNRQGFNGTSLDEIAEHLNVSKGAFYYHIRNKEDLLFNCYCYSLDILETIHNHAAKTMLTGLTKAELTCRRTFYFQNSEEGPLIRYNSITALPMERRRQILARTEEANERFGTFLQEGILDGSVRPINTFVAQQLIAGAINAAMDIKQWRKVKTIDGAAIDYFNIFFNGLLPRALSPASQK
ncbi:MAG: TetR/AcrR family transcriptional regulator [Halioglobus sp.]